MLNLVLKRNHELYRRSEQGRFENDYKSSDSNCMSCEETVLECLDWNQENPEDKVEFMIRTPDQWSGSFIRPTNGFCRIHKVVLDQNIPIPRPEVDAISFVKYNLKHSDGLLTPWDLMNCKENLYQEELYKRCEALLRQCLDWNRNSDKGLIQYAIKTPKIWNHEKIKARPKFQLVTDIEETTHRIQPRDQLDKYESCSRQNNDIIRQIEQTEFFNISETLHYIQTIKDYFDHNKTTRRRTPKQTFNIDGDITRRHDRDITRRHDREITRRQYESFDILLAPAKNPNAIPKMSSWHKVYRKPNPEEKVKSVESPATQTDALLDKENVSFDIIFEEPKNLVAKPKLSSGKRKAKHEDFYNDTKQGEDYQTSVQHENNIEQIKGEKQYQQAGTDVESVLNPGDDYGYPQWAARPLLPIAEAPTPVEMGLVSGRDIERNKFVSLEKNKQEVYRCLDRKVIPYEPGRFRFSSLHRFSDRPSRIPIMVAYPYENRRLILYPRVSRIPIRIKGYMWKSMDDKNFPAPVQSLPGSLIPLRKTTIQGIYDSNNAFSHNKNGQTEQNKIGKFKGISPEQRGKRNAVSRLSPEQRGKRNAVSRLSPEQRGKRNAVSRLSPKQRGERNAVSRLSPERRGKRNAVSRLSHVEFNIHGQSQEKVERNAITTTTIKKGKRNSEENCMESRNVLNTETDFPKPVLLPPIGRTSPSEKPFKQEYGSLSPPHSPFGERIESSIESTSRPASVTGYPILPPIGGVGKPRLMSAAGKRQLPPIISRPLSATGYAKLPPISTSK